MKKFVLLILLFANTLQAQKYAQYDTMKDAKLALVQLQSFVKTDATNPELFFRIAKVKRKLTENDSTIFYCNVAIEKLNRNPNKLLLLQTLRLKGTAQYLLDDRSKAQVNWQQALQLAIALKNAEEIAGLASNIGSIHLDKTESNKYKNNRYILADSFFAIAYKALSENNLLASDQGMLTLRLMGTSLQYQNKYDSANYYYSVVVKNAKQNDKGVYISALTSYAQNLSEMGKHNMAIQKMQEAITVSKNSAQEAKILVAILDMYSQILWNASDTKGAYQLNDSALTILTADYAKTNVQAYAESESKFRNEILQYQIQLEQQKKNKLYFWLGAVLLLGATTALWLYNRNKKHIAQEQAKQKQIAIDAFIEGEEKEKARIGRELHDGIAQEIVGIKLAMHQQNADVKMIDELTRISLEIRNISHELMPQTLKEFGLKLAIEDICQKILLPSSMQYELHDNIHDERFANKIEITLYRIFQELTHNIIKHSKATEVLVQLRKMNNHILLSVEDNGKGFSNKANDGIGINNLKNRVQLVEGNIQYESSENEGTTTIVRIPL